MGTHPIFESDFDCLTDDAETVSWSHCGNSQCRFMRQYRFDWAVVHGREWNVKSDRSKGHLCQGQHSGRYQLCPLQQRSHPPWWRPRQCDVDWLSPSRVYIQWQEYVGWRLVRDGWTWYANCRKIVHHLPRAISRQQLHTVDQRDLLALGRCGLPDKWLWRVYRACLFLQFQQNEPSLQRILLPRE